MCCCIALTIAYGCSSQKDSATNRGLQNLSARYNLIYNADIILTTYQDELAQSHVDNYDNFLPVYIAPEAIDYLSAAPASANKSLDEISQKAQVIIAEKGLSNYIDEANMLLAKTNFYKGNYFTALAYFEYTAKAYRQNPKTYLEAMTWKSKSLLQLNENEKAVAALDTVRIYLDSVKSGKSEPLSTLAQMSIYQSDFPNAIQYLTVAIKESNRAQHKIRWSYLLAQLYEHQKQFKESLENYSKVEKSNAPFEMYFNAKLSKIRINDALNHQNFNRNAQLLKLLKDDKNIEYTDQIYYEVAEDYMAQQDFAKAKEYYLLSVQKSSRNPYQKGLSYLHLADLNFKSLRNYVDAKAYYDSAATTLPKTYPGYQAIVKKAQNLEYLTTRYELIAAQDTLQNLAKLPEQIRDQRITEMFTPKSVTTILPNNTLPTNSTNRADNANSRTSNSTFYFSNASAIAKGFSDFKKRWGNRPIEDNWRQSVKSSAQINQQNQTAAIGSPTDTTTNAQQKLTTADLAAKRAAYTATLPLTATQLQVSNQQIVDAYFDIAGFYQQVLEDEEEAIRVYETLLSHFPQNNHLEAIYYSLYLAYAKSNAQKSEAYKNLVLTNYPNSAYAKTILDPNFSAKQNALEVAVNNNYNETFSNYEKKDFANVIVGVNQNNQRFPGNVLQAQFDYLKAIAIGRTQNLDSLLTAFNQIINSYPNDQLITPLVKDHLVYINANLASFKGRPIALIDFDPTEPRFVAQRETAAPVVKQTPTVTPPPVQNLPTNNQPPVSIPPPVEKPAQVVIPPVQTAPTVQKDTTTKAAVVDNLFSKAESSLYYYVISVADMSVSVSSSRFGVGQFNRGNYAGNGLKHQLLELTNDQLIFVGNFATLTDVKTYAEGINAQLSKIMKVPASIYTSFYISKENFDKIKTRETLQRYIEFFKNNY